MHILGEVLALPAAARIPLPISRPRGGLGWLCPSEYEYQWLADREAARPLLRGPRVIHPLYTGSDHDDFEKIAEMIAPVAAGHVVGVTIAAHENGILRWVPGAIGTRLLRIVALAAGNGLMATSVDDDADTAEDHVNDYVAPDQVEHIVQLAREGREAEFRELAPLLGIPADQIDECWAGTVARVQKTK